MSKYGFLSVLEEELDNHLSYDFAMDWDKKNHAVEVSFLLEVGLPEGVELEDFGDEEALAFEEAVLFYNPAKSKVNPDDYLATIAYEPKKGLSREFLAYFAQFLQATADQGMDDLLEFLTDDTAEEFQMTWDSQAFEHGRATVEEGVSYPYPRY